MHLCWLLFLSVLLLHLEHKQTSVGANQEPVFRAKRAANFNEIHSKLTRASRIFSGIALKIKIHDGSLTGDQLISEMLNLGSINLDDVEKFEKDKVTGFFEKLVGVKDPTDGAQQLEKKILTMNSLREHYEGIKDLDNTQSIDQYIGKVDAFKKANVDYQLISRTDTAITSVLTPLQKLADSASRGQLISAELSTIQTYLDEVEKLPNATKALINQLEAHKDLLNAEVLKSAIVKQVKLIKEYSSYVTKVFQMSPTTADDFQTALTTITSLKADFDAAKKYIDVVNQIVASQSSRTSSLGFIYGFSDVIKLESDLQDAWLSTAIEKYDSELVNSELKPLEKFKASFNNLNAVWKVLTSDVTIERVSTIVQTFGNPADDSLLKKVADKKMFGSLVDYFYPIKKLTSEILKFRETLIFLHSKLPTILEVDGISNLTKLIEFKKLIDFSNAQTVQQVIAKMPPPEEIKNLISVLQGIQKVLTDIQKTLTPNDLNTLAGSIESKKSEVAKFVNDPIKKDHFKYFGELGGLSLDKLIGAADLLKTFQAIKKDQNTFKPALAEISDKIHGSIVDFKNLRAVSVNSTKTTRIQDLLELKKIDTNSLDFRQAVVVLDTVQMVLSKKGDIQEFLKNGWEVQGSLNDPALKDDWALFGELALYFGNLIADVEKITDSMTSANRHRRQLTTLEDYANKLTDLKDLPDLEIDLKPLAQVLRTLPNNPNSLKTLLELETLDLQFSTKSTALNNAGSSASKVINLFSEAAQKAQSAPPGSSMAPGTSVGTVAPESSGKPGTMASSSGNGQKKSDESSWGVGKILGTISILAILACLGVALGIYLCHRQKKKNEEKKKKKEETPLLLPAPVAPASAAPSGSTSKLTSAKKTVDTATTESTSKKPATPAPVAPAAAPAAAPATTPATPVAPVAPAVAPAPVAPPSERSARDVDLTPEEIAIRRPALFRKYLENHVYIIAYSAAEEAQQGAQFLATHQSRNKQIEIEIAELEERMPEMVKKAVHNEMVFKHGKITGLQRKFLIQMIHNEYLDAKEHVAAIRHLFEQLGGQDIVKQVTLMCDVWSVDKNDSWTSKRRLSDDEFKFVLKNMTTFKITLVKYEAAVQLSLLPLSYHASPYQLRIKWAQSEVEELEKTKKIESTKFPATGAAKEVVPFDNLLVRMDPPFNASYLPMPYGENVYLTRALEDDSLNDFFWNTRPGFVVTWYMCRSEDAKETGEFSRTTAKYELTFTEENLTGEDDEMLKVEGGFGDEAPGEKVIISWKVTMKKRRSDEEISFVQCIIRGWDSPIIPKDVNYRNIIRLLMSNVTRQRGKPAIFMDSDGGERAATLVLSELIASSIMTYGIMEADLSLYLVRINSCRKNAIRSVEHVMFALALAIDRVHLEHNGTPNYPQEISKLWDNFSGYNDAKDNQRQLTERFGPKVAKDLGLKEDRQETIEIDLTNEGVFGQDRQAAKAKVDALEKSLKGVKKVNT